MPSDPKFQGSTGLCGGGFGANAYTIHSDEAPGAELAADWVRDAAYPASNDKGMSIGDPVCVIFVDSLVTPTTAVGRAERVVSAINAVTGQATLV